MVNTIVISDKDGDVNLDDRTARKARKVEGDIETALREGVITQKLADELRGMALPERQMAIETVWSEAIKPNQNANSPGIDKRVKLPFADTGSFEHHYSEIKPYQSLLEASHNADRIERKVNSDIDLALEEGVITQELANELRGMNLPKRYMAIEAAWAAVAESNKTQAEQRAQVEKVLSTSA